MDRSGWPLTAAAVPLWMRLSLPEECRGRAEQALADSQGGSETGCAPRDEATRRRGGIADL